MKLKEIALYLENKFMKITGYKGRYNEVMQEYKEKAINERGFWQQANRIRECDATEIDIY